MFSFSLASCLMAWIFYPKDLQRSGVGLTKLQSRWMLYSSLHVLGEHLLAFLLPLEVPCFWASEILHFPSQKWKHFLNLLICFLLSLSDFRITLVYPKIFQASGQLMNNTVVWLCSIHNSDVPSVIELRVEVCKAWFDLSYSLVRKNEAYIKAFMHIQ